MLMRTLEPITDRLTRELTERASADIARNLKPALGMACEQLEFLCPALMGRTPDGMDATLAAQVNLGTWLIVLANPRKVLTIHLRRPPLRARFSRLDIIEDAVACVAAAFSKPLAGGDLQTVIDHAVTTHGGAPGARTKAADDQVVRQIIGLLFCLIPRTDRAAILKGVEKLSAADVCPLHVGLSGCGSKPRTSSVVWPLGLPFAPYVESVGE